MSMSSLPRYDAKPAVVSSASALWVWRLAMACTPFVVFGHALFGGELFSGYADEALVLLLTLTFLFWKWRRDQAPIVITTIGAMISLSAIGLFSALANDQLVGFPVVEAASLTLLADMKVLIVGLALGLYCFPRLSGGHGVPYKLVDKGLWIFAIIPVFNLPFIVLDMFSSGYSLHGALLLRGLDGYMTQGFLSHKFLNAISLSIGIIAAVSLIYRGRRRRLLMILVVLYAAALLTTQDIKSLVSVLSFILTVSLLRPSRFRPGLIAASAVVVVVGLVFTGPTIVDKVNRFVLGDRGENIRTVAWPTATLLANQHFPLGSGAGTFGSAASFSVGYSPVYYATGLSQMHGAAENSEDRFLLDFTWPKFLGEYGYFGGAIMLLLFLGFAFRAAKVAARTVGEKSFAQVFAWGMMCFIIIQSLALSILTVSYALVPMGLAIAITLASPMPAPRPVRRIRFKFS